ncbi:unnamed protein product [Linum trigynum]|uniref:KIB1-4 beta-propeller domain-containing protein n=1 Tax=Linum trigynum TaxID=586398 RepID=A0AAV2DBA9_9ROSI
MISCWALVCSTTRQATLAGEVGTPEVPRHRWDELCPDLLNSIYGKLPPGHYGRTDFGSVCRNWHRIHAAAGTPPLTAPLAGGRNHPIDVRSHIGDDIPGGRVRWLFCYARRLLSLPQLHVVYTWSSGWWLLESNRLICACFNPLLPWPSCYHKLPNLGLRPFDEIPEIPIKAAFSAPPSRNRSWTILVVHSRWSFSTFRRGRGGGGWWWNSYTYCRKGELEAGARICEGIGYREGRFFLLFNTGDVLVFGIDGGERRMLVVGVPPLVAGELSRRKNLRVVAAVEEEESSLVVSWGRGSGGGDGRLRLMTVERWKPAAGEVEDLELEEGSRGGVLMAREQPGVVKWIAIRHVCWTLYFFLWVGIFSFIVFYLVRIGNKGQ